MQKLNLKIGGRVRAVFGGPPLTVEFLPDQFLYAPKGFVGVLHVAADGTKLRGWIDPSFLVNAAPDADE